VQRRIQDSDQVRFGFIVRSRWNLARGERRVAAYGAEERNEWRAAFGLRTEF